MTPAAAKVDCALCGLPVGSSIYESLDKQFCCHGCVHVYTILQESGALRGGQDPRETDLFKRSLAAGLVAQTLPESDAKVATEEPSEITLHLDGMWCASCGWLVEHLLLREPGIVAAEVLFTSDLLKVRYLPRRMPPSRIGELTARLGYKAGEYKPGVNRTSTRERDLLLRLGVAGFIWMNVMTLSSVFYVSYFESIADTMRAHLPFVLMVLTAPAIFYSAWPVLRLAALGARERVLRMETLLALGILSAYGFSVWQAFSGGVHFYFDTACAIVTFVLIGKLIEAGAKERASRAIHLLHRMMPQKARVLHGGQERWVSVARLDAGVLFTVKPGERVPADGVIVEGRSLLEESIITGESRPIEKQPGRAVIGGSLNVSGALVVRATEEPGHGTLARMVEAVERALASRARSERRVDRVTAIFVPAVLALAIATFLGWFYIAGAPVPDALLHAIAVLVIACPCALGIATPLAVSSAIAAASRMGILIGNADVWETVDRIDTVVFDKTGTVTTGEFRVVRCLGDDEDELLHKAAAVEVLAEHPVARAITTCARERKICVEPARDVLRIPGMGVTGTVNNDEVFAGNERMALQLAGSIPGMLHSSVESWRKDGLVAVFIGWNGAVRGAICCGDPVRPDAAEAIESLHAAGLRTALLSGDAATTTAAVCRSVGILEYEAEVLPDNKAGYIARLTREGRTVAMVGDGVNDAPALAGATLGVAMGSGSALAMEAAPVVLMTPSLDRIAAIFALARQTVHTVRRNLFWAFAYNIAGLTLAVAGIITPLWAAAAMILSSLSVIAQSGRLARWSPETRK